MKEICLFLFKMKKCCFTLLFLLFVRIDISAEPVSEIGENGKLNSHFQTFSKDFLMIKSFIIDEFDTVVFDLSRSILNGNYIEFPVYILSDDSIFSLDFSLKYDHSKLEYDTIFNEVNYLESLSFYNSSDSTIRYTSSSFQKYGNDTALVSIRFSTFYGQIKNKDLNNLFAYLNGSSCSIKLINPLPTFIFENKEILSKLKIFPNPASDFINICTDENISVQLFDVNCKQLFFQGNIFAGDEYQLIVQKFQSGIYYLRIFNEKFRSIRKIVIER